MLLTIWRHVSSHVTLKDLLPRIAPVIRERLPSTNVVVLRADVGRRRLDAIAVGQDPAVTAAACHHRELTASELEDLLTWGLGETVLRASDSAAPPHLRALLCPDHDGDFLAGPLVGGPGEQGVLLVVSDRSPAFNAEHEAFAQALLEPMAIALQNDRRVSEISDLRNTAEADKLSLLRRLGRDSMLDVIVGSEFGLKSVMERVDVVAFSDLPVLILGETGSGKEVIARAIHQRSPRQAGPFLRVNCGAIPSELIDSELFGHERGSFTGATNMRKGWFERAHGGSLFLDEVSELATGAQVRLLRVLQDGTYERVGGQRTLTADVRVIAATHPDLQTRVADGRFREDLWYRIAIFPIELPPLRDRLGDMQALANHFAQRSARRFGHLALPVLTEDLRLLLDYSWPGNARELAAVMDRAVILGQGRRLEIRKALGMPLGPTASQRAANGLQAENGCLGNRANTGHQSASARLDDIVRGHIKHVLASTGGKIEGRFGAARLLDVNPHTLRARMRKLGIDWSEFRPAT